MPESLTETVPGTVPDTVPGEKRYPHEYPHEGPYFSSDQLLPPATQNFELALREGFAEHKALVIKKWGSPTPLALV